MAGIARIVAAAVLALATAACAAGGANAHAVLLHADPADDATLAVQPEAVTLMFNETVSVIAARVLDAQGRAVAQHDGAAPGARVVVTLPRGLPTGSYIATWRVISADSHPVAGSLVFAVGSPSAPAAAPATDDDAATRLAAIAIRALRDVALLFAAGGGLFVVLVLRGAAPPALARAIRGAAAVGIVAAALGVGIVGALAAGTGPDPFDATSWRLGLQTTAASAAALTAAGLAALAAAMPAATRSRRLLAAIAAFAAAAGPALTGHARAAPGTAMPTLQALHNIAAAFWIGAFWPLLLLARGGDAALTLRAARRFSAIALAAVGVLVAAGLTSALAHADGVADLLASAYGDFVLAKLAGVALLLAVAACNRLVILPALAAGDGRAARRFVSALCLDLGVGIAVVIVTAFLVHTPPPHGNAHGHRHDMPPSSAGIARGFTVAIASGARSLLIAIADRRAGTTTMSLEFSNADGTAFAPREVSVEFALPEAGIAPIRRVAAPVGPGRHRVEYAAFPLAGRWRLRIDALVSDFEKAVYETTIEIH